MIAVGLIRAAVIRGEQLRRDPDVRHHLAAGVQARLREEQRLARRAVLRRERDHRLVQLLRDEVARCRGCGEWCWGQLPCSVCGRAG